MCIVVELFYFSDLHLQLPYHVKVVTVSVFEPFIYWYLQTYWNNAHNKHKN